MDDAVSVYRRLGEVLDRRGYRHLDTSDLTDDQGLLTSLGISAKGKRFTVDLTVRPDGRTVEASISLPRQLGELSFLAVLNDINCKRREAAYAVWNREEDCVESLVVVPAAVAVTELGIESVIGAVSRMAFGIDTVQNGVKDRLTAKGETFGLLKTPPTGTPGAQPAA